MVTSQGVETKGGHTDHPPVCPTTKRALRLYGVKRGRSNRVERALTRSPQAGTTTRLGRVNPSEREVVGNHLNLAALMGREQPLNVYGCGGFVAVEAQHPLDRDGALQ